MTIGMSDNTADILIPRPVLAVVEPDAPATDNAAAVPDPLPLNVAEQREQYEATMEMLTVLREIVALRDNLPAMMDAAPPMVKMMFRGMMP